MVYPGLGVGVTKTVCVRSAFAFTPPKLPKSKLKPASKPPSPAPALALTPPRLPKPKSNSPPIPCVPAPAPNPPLNFEKIKFHSVIPDG